MVHKKEKKASAKLLSASCTEAHIKEARTEGTAVSKERSDNISSRTHGQQDAWPAFGGWRRGKWAEFTDSVSKEKEMEGIGEKVKVAILENCQQQEKGGNGKEEEDVYFTQQEIH